MSKRLLLVIILIGLASHALGDTAADEMRALGEYLSAECVTCHQLSGEHDGIPSIVGWDSWAFVTVMQEYRDKTRTHQVMQTLAAALSDEEIEALAAYFGSIRPESE